MIEFAISSLVSPEAYRTEGRTHVFPSPASLSWFIRKHKQRLLKQNALVSPTGRKLINPQPFDAVIIEVAHALTTRGGSIKQSLSSRKTA